MRLPISHWEILLLLKVMLITFNLENVRQRHNECNQTDIPLWSAIPNNSHPKIWSESGWSFRLSGCWVLIWIRNLITELKRWTSTLDNEAPQWTHPSGAAMYVWLTRMQVNWVNLLSLVIKSSNNARLHCFVVLFAMSRERDWGEKNWASEFESWLRLMFPSPTLYGNSPQPSSLPTFFFFPPSFFDVTSHERFFIRSDHFFSIFL